MPDIWSISGACISVHTNRNVALPEDVRSLVFFFQVPIFVYVYVYVFFFFFFFFLF